MVIALLTDFGTRDHFVAAMKGTILSINPAATIIDISHEIPPFDITAATFILNACWRDFPPETIFVSVIDPGVGSSRSPILAVSENKYFIAPDNGIISFAVAGNAAVFEISNEKYFRHPVSGTFHGRDIFAPVAAHLSIGAKPQDFGPRVADFQRIVFPSPQESSDTEIYGEIIYFDHFGNIITNFPNSLIARGKAVEIGDTVAGDKRRFYAESTAEDLFIIAGSSGFIEISMNRKSARDFLCARRGQKLKLILK